MSIADTLQLGAELGVDVFVSGGTLRLKGPAEAVAKLSSVAIRHKPELIAFISNEATEGVGDCYGCNEELIGLRTFDGYTNRTCPGCGKWFRCLPPIEQQAESSCTEELDSVESKMWPPTARTIGDLSSNYKGVE